jgi:hypothetical protein
MSFNTSLLRRHPVIKTYLQWRNNELEKDIKDKALEVLQPCVDKVIESSKLTEKQKEQITISVKQQTGIYDSHKELIEEIL